MYISELIEEEFAGHKALVPDMTKSWLVDTKKIIYLSKDGNAVSVHFVGGDKLSFYTYKNIGHFTDVNPIFGD